MSVPSTWHFSSGIRANNFVSSHLKKIVYMYTNVYNHIHPEFHEFAFTLCCMCCALKAHNKQQANECIDSIFWVKNTAQKEKERKKEKN